MDRGLLEEFMDQTQYSEYTQPGAENYREVLLTNPEYKGDPSFKLTEAQEARFQEPGDKVNAEKKVALVRLQLMRLMRCQKQSMMNLYN